MAKSAAPLLLAGGAALLLMSGKKKKSTKKKGSNGTSGKVTCPPVVHLTSNSFSHETIEKEFEDENGKYTMEVKVPKVAYALGVAGSRNIIEMTTKVLEPFLPESCLSSESIRIELTTDLEDEQPRKLEFKAVEAFYLFGLDILEDLYQVGIFSEDEANAGLNELNKWWVERMGEAPLPQI